MSSRFFLYLIENSSFFTFITNFKSLCSVKLGCIQKIQINMVFPFVWIYFFRLRKQKYLLSLRLLEILH